MNLTVQSVLRQQSKSETRLGFRPLHNVATGVAIIGLITDGCSALRIRVGF
jgi:hypothetical protein